MVEISYEIDQSSTGGTVASLYTAAQAVSRSKPVMFFLTASATSESACVATYVTRHYIVVSESNV